MSATVVTYFTNYSVPATGLSPTVSIWRVDTGAAVVTAGSMTEMGSGFYQYVFTLHDPEIDYIVQSDGGATLEPGERIQVGDIVTRDAELTPASETRVAGKVWDQQTSDHVQPGSFGELVQMSSSLTPGEIATIADAVWDELLAPHNVPGSTGQTLATALDLLRTILKYNANRTKIDPTAFTLSVYDDDTTTPIKVFSLRDRNGTPSISEVFERVPQ